MNIQIFEPTRNNAELIVLQKFDSYIEAVEYNYIVSNMFLGMLRHDCDALYIVRKLMLLRRHENVPMFFFELESTASTV